MSELGLFATFSSPVALLVPCGGCWQVKRMLALIDRIHEMQFLTLLPATKLASFAIAIHLWVEVKSQLYCILQPDPIGFVRTFLTYLAASALITDHHPPGTLDPRSGVGNQAHAS